VGEANAELTNPECIITPLWWVPRSLSYAISVWCNYSQHDALGFFVGAVAVDVMFVSSCS